MAVSNASDKATTVKNMFMLLDSDNYTIDRAILYCNYNEFDMDIVYENIMDKYRDYFEKYLVEVDVPEKFYYQPAAFAEYYYGTPGLDFLILYFAKMKSLFEFKKPTISALPKSRLTELNRLFTKYSSEVTANYKNPTEYIEESEY